MLGKTSVRNMIWMHSGLISIAYMSPLDYKNKGSNDTNLPLPNSLSTALDIELHVTSVFEHVTYSKKSRMTYGIPVVTHEELCQKQNFSQRSCMNQPSNSGTQLQRQQKS